MLTRRNMFGSILNGNVKQFLTILYFEIAGNIVEILCYSKYIYTTLISAGMFNPILYLVRSMVPHTCQPFTLSRPTTVGRTLGFKHYCGKNDKRGKHVLKIFTNHRDHKVQLVLLYNMFPSYFANVGRKKGRDSGERNKAE